MERPYCKVLDDIGEAVARLSLHFSVPPEHVVLVGDWNAHLQHLPAGIVDDSDMGDVGGPRG